MDLTFELVVIGGGAAGLGAARSAAGAGRRVALVTAGEIGGDCTFTGCVPSKTLIEAAEQRLTFEQAMRRANETIDRIAATESADVLSGEGIEVIEGHAAFRDAHHLDVGGTVLRADHIVIATGSSPVVPKSLSGASILTTDTFWSQSSAPASLAIVGGGAIGCELAQATARFGVPVSLVEGSQQLLPLEEPDVAVVVRAALERDGVKVRVGSTVESLDCQGLTLADGEPVTADRVLVAIGRRPDTLGLQVQAAGVDVDEAGYLVTDEKLRTTAPHIYAAGDVTGRMPFTHAADAMGRLAARNAFAAAGRRFDTDPIPWVIFTDPEVARVGLREDQASEHDRVAYLPLEEVDRAITAGRTEGFVRIIAGPRRGAGSIGGGRVLGATIVAPRAGEMIGELALAMRTSMFTGRLAQTVHAYPTYSVALQQAAAQFFTTVGGRTARQAGRS